MQWCVTLLEQYRIQIFLSIDTSVAKFALVYTNAIKLKIYGRSSV